MNPVRELRKIAFLLEKKGKSPSEAMIGSYVELMDILESLNKLEDIGSNLKKGLPLEQSKKFDQSIEKSQGTVDKLKNELKALQMEVAQALEFA